MTTLTALQWIWVVLIGLVAGTISGSLGVGSAIIMIPALVYFLVFSQKTAQAMSLLVMAPMVLMAATRYCLNPTIKINPWIVAVLAAAAVVGANIGSSIAFELSAEILRKVFAVFIVGAGLLILWK